MYINWWWLHLLCYTRLVMSSLAIILVGASAFVHASWNLLGKRQNPSLAFFFIASVFAALCFSPLLWIYHAALPSIPARVWGWLVLTSLFEVVYFIGLAGAYRHGDMSVAYPLARALPVILVAIITAIFGLGKSLSLPGVVGILAVAFGCLVLPQRRLGKIRLGDYLNGCCLLAGVAALGTAGYTLVDNQALFDLRSAPNISLNPVQIAFFYLALESVIISIALGAYVYLSTSDRAALKETWHSSRNVSFVTGLLIVGTYGLVLASMAYASNVSYIAAFRQLSIPLGASMGILIQKEPAYTSKITSVGIIFGGLILIALA
jgi:drug/metabolite transporter (DMT)-like permease